MLRRSTLAKAVVADGGTAPPGKPGKSEEAILARSAGLHGTEMLRLGYTLSQVVLAYGAMCQTITGMAAAQKVDIPASDFHDLNQCLDVAIAGAVTEYEHLRVTQERGRETEHLGRSRMSFEMRSTPRPLHCTWQPPEL